MNNKLVMDLPPEHGLSAVVGIGASAGGLSSIEAFFEGMPEDLGVAFVVIQHLSPDHKSHMVDLIARRTRMRTILADQEQTLQPNAIYVIPPGKELRCVGQTLSVSPLGSRPNRPIDAFFCSMAESCDFQSIGIVLSGTGTDGSIGIEALHREGGLTVAESQASAKFDGMPLSAVRTGCINQVLEASEIPNAIRDFLSNYEKLPAGQDEYESSIEEIFELISRYYKVDFKQYKPQTLIRRIRRRQALQGYDELGRYAECLRTEPAELKELYADLLIGVTKFFRDADAFDSLEHHLLSAVAAHPNDEVFRAWVIGCSTGEEAYSIAILLLDIMKRLKRPPLLKVFATDLDDSSLESASSGVFRAADLDFVPLVHQQTYFNAIKGGSFRVSQQLRQHLVFSRHNVFQDPPFTNMNLVSCRNTLIYFGTNAQFATLASAHFALRKSGILFLGASESLGSLSEEFETLEPTHKVFRKTGVRRDLLSSFKRTNTVIQAVQGANPKRTINADQFVPLTIRDLIEVYDAVMQSQMKVGILLDERQNLVHAIGDAASLLKGASNRFRGTIGDVLDAPARTLVVSALQLAAKEPGTQFVVEDVQPNLDLEECYTVKVLALQSNEKGVGWIVSFDSREQTKASVTVSRDPSSAYESLENELQFTRESLNASVEELESGNEELQATNEEMIAANEELQSVNEELHSVNEELQRKIVQLEETTADLEAFLATSHLGTIFLDSKDRIRKFTNATLRHFSLVEHDIGRPLADFTNKLNIEDMRGLIRRVADSGETFSSDVVDAYGESVRLVIDPFRSRDSVSGSVVTILRRSATDELESVASSNSTQVGLWEWPDLSKDEMWWSPTCYRILDLAPDSPALFSRWKQMIHEDDLAQLNRIGTNSCKFIELGKLSFRMSNADDSYRILEFRNIPSVGRTQVIRSMVGSVFDLGPLDG